MTVLISQYTVYLFGVVIVVLSVWGFVVPNRLIALVTGSMNRGSGLYVGIGSRVVLGVALIVAAPPARFPTLFAVLGWISIAAAIALLLVGRARLRALLGWFERMLASGGVAQAATTTDICPWALRVRVTRISTS